MRPRAIDQKDCPSDCVAGKRQLAKIRDLAQLLKRDGESCLEPRLERARQGGGERLVLVSLALVHRTLEVVLPEWVELGQSLDIYWNDHQLTATLLP